MFFTIINIYGGEMSLQEFLNADETKYFVVGPALVTFGLIVNRFSVPEMKNFEDDPIVKWLGGAEVVRRARDNAADALRF